MCRLHIPNLLLPIGSLWGLIGMQEIRSLVELSDGLCHLKALRRLWISIVNCPNLICIDDLRKGLHGTSKDMKQHVPRAQEGINSKGNIINMKYFI